MRVWWMLIKNSVIVLVQMIETAFRLTNRPAGGFFVFTGLLYQQYQPINK